MNLDPNLQILVVDDFMDIRRYIRDSLKELGFGNVDEASDGAKALQKLQVHPYNLVITDWHMPNLSGLDMVKAMRSNPELKNIPVLMITAEGLKQNIVEAAKVGVNHYIIKPFTSVTLKKTMEKILK